MADDRIGAAARLLAAARRDGSRLERLPEAAAPRDDGEALAIQMAVARLCGGTIRGWKAGLENGACLWETLPSPAAYEGSYLIEGEIGLRMGRDLPGPGPYGRDAVLDAVAGGFVGIELVESRFRDAAAVPPLHALADHLSNRAFVSGADAAAWRVDLTRLAATVAIDGAVIVERIGGHAAGDPLRTLVALANWLPTHGFALRRGDLVFTGSCTGVVPATSGQTVRVAFAGYGEAEVRLA